MVHPALAALVIDFFYSLSSLNSVFPEVFSCEAPKVAVYLAATVVCAFHFPSFPVVIHIICSFGPPSMSTSKMTLDKTASSRL